MRYAWLPFLILAASALGAEPAPVEALPGDFKGGALQPALALSPSGAVAMVFGTDTGEIYVSLLEPGASTFTAPSLVAKEDKLTLAGRRGPRITATDKALIVSFITRAGNLVCCTSTDAGKLWTGPVQVNAKEGSAEEGLHALVSRPGGEVLFIWMDRGGRGPQEMGQDVFSARARIAVKDRDNFTQPEKVSTAAVCPCCAPSLSYGGGKIAAMWRSEIKGCRDLYVSALEQQKRGFGEGKKQGSGTWKINACPMDGGGLALDGEGKAWTAWRREKTVYASTPESPELPLGTGKDPVIAVGSKGTVALWTDRDAIYMKRLGETGEAARLSTPAAGIKQGSASVVALPDGGFLAAWEEQGPDKKGTIKTVHLP